jgi:hypothetical protein
MLGYTYVALICELYKIFYEVDHAFFMIYNIRTCCALCLHINSVL